MLPLVKYSMVSVVRNPSRSIYSILGVVLALALVSGTLVAVDSASYVLKKAALDEVPVDFIGESSNPVTDFNESSLLIQVQSLAGISGIVDVIPLVVMHGWTVFSTSITPSEAIFRSTSVMFIPNESDSLMSSYRVCGSLPLPGTVAISNETAQELGVGVGDRVNCSRALSVFRIENETVVHSVVYLNTSFVVSKVWTQAKSASEIDYQRYVGLVRAPDPDTVVISENVNPIVLRIEDARLIIDRMVALLSDSQIADDTWSVEDASYQYFVWVNRHELISIVDTDDTIDRLNYVGNRLDIVGYDYGISFDESPLIEPLRAAGEELGKSKPLLVAMSVPAIAIGMYVAMVGCELAARRRRREIGVLRSRGASDRWLLRSLLIENSMLGIAAALLGLLCGVIVSRFILQVATSFSSIAYAQPTLSDVVMEPATILLTVLFGVLIMIASAVIPLNGLRKLRIVDALRGYDEVAEQVEYSPRADYLLLAASGVCVASVSLQSTISTHGDSLMSQVALDVLSVYGLFFIWAVPLILPVALSRLVVLGSPGVVAGLSCMVRWWTQGLHSVVRSNIVRNPRRSTQITLMLSMVMAFGMFATITMDSSDVRAEELIRTQVGADVSLFGTHLTGAVADFNLSTLNKIDDITGVKNYCPFQGFPVTEEIHNQWVPLLVFDSQKYVEISQPSDYWFYESDSSPFRDLYEGGAVLVDMEFADRNGLLIGDTLPVRYEYINSTSHTLDSLHVSTRIVGIVSGLPGLGDYKILTDYATIPILPEQLCVESFDFGALVSIQEGQNPAVVASESSEVFSMAGLEPSRVIVLEFELEGLGEDPSYGSLQSFLIVEFALSLMMIACGTGLVVFASVSDRRHELARMIARGVSRCQMRRLILGEQIPLVAIATLIGVSVGMLTAFVLNDAMRSTEHEMIEYPLVVSAHCVLVVLGGICAMIIAPVVASSVASEMNVAQVMKTEGD